MGKQLLNSVILKYRDFSVYQTYLLSTFEIHKGLPENLTIGCVTNQTTNTDK